MMRTLKLFKVIIINIALLFVASCALKVSTYVETAKNNNTDTPTPTSTTTLNFYMAGIYVDGSPSYWINDQRISCDNIPGSYLPNPPMLAVDSTGDMFMIFDDAESSNAGICINRTYNELLPPSGEVGNSVSTLNGIAEENGEIYIVGSVYRSQIDCVGTFHSDMNFGCAAIWKSSTSYTAEYVPIDTGVLPNVDYVYPTSIYLDNGHVYISANIYNHNGSWDVGYWLDGVFYKQTSLFSGIPNISSTSIYLYQIKTYNGSVYESGLYTTTDKKMHFFYIKDGVISIVDNVPNTTSGTITGLNIVNDVVYMAINTYNASWIPSSFLIIGTQVTTLLPKDSTYYTYAYGLNVDSNGVAYVVGSITSKTDYSSLGAIWRTDADPVFYNGVSYFSSLILK
ncbi:MAG: hypothetical protein NTY22_03980 [Proteobacteria bacterium]|nr:hypothetical protein [Pseudomonadota bacterium]